MNITQSLFSSARIQKTTPSKKKLMVPIYGLGFSLTFDIFHTLL